MNARRRVRAVTVGCLAACSLPLAALTLTAVPAGAAPAHERPVLVALHAGPETVLGTEAESETTTSEGEGEGEKAEAKSGKSPEKDNGLGIGIIAGSLAFGLLAAPILKLAGLNKPS